MVAKPEISIKQNPTIECRNRVLSADLELAGKSRRLKTALAMLRPPGKQESTNEQKTELIVLAVSDIKLVSCSDRVKHPVK